MFNYIKALIYSQGRILKDEEGQGLVEYALIIALIAVLLIAALTALKVDIAAVFGKISTAMK